MNHDPLTTALLCAAAVVDMALAGIVLAIGAGVHLALLTTLGGAL